eukprot:CAMPEP_0178511308 /NCGR_PEP_ID=MMETSP0696-20121128/22297_1 /TAXON_ID=265572 /ORGANISM="Extubocellulus spinifer, Strain CCMP396" /LENGTH=113 /DNA_ID=CAMNT_0020141081 /DNA_START=393 /DNA_END=731 /DNA_ORIENTATION=+
MALFLGATAAFPFPVFAAADVTITVATATANVVIFIAHTIPINDSVRIIISAVTLILAANLVSLVVVAHKVTVLSTAPVSFLSVPVTGIVIVTAIANLVIAIAHAIPINDSVP